MAMKNDIVYYARIVPETDIYDVCELKIRTVKDDWFVGVDKRDKHAYLFYGSSINDSVFYERKNALNKVREAENNKKYVNQEIYYEEY